MDHIISIILAGGEGTRLFPLTRFRSKPDVRFGGRYRLIDVPLSNSLNSHIERIFILTQHFTESLHQHILSAYPPDYFQSHKIEMLTPRSKSLYKGTADAVRQNLDAIRKTEAEYFLILAGDQLYQMDFHDLINFAKERHADLVIASLPVDEPEARRMGLLKIDGQSEIKDFFEKPQDRKTLDAFALPGQPGKYLGSMGIYVFRRDALIALLQNEGDDFGKHIIPLQIKNKNNFAFVYDGYWEDIGTIKAYFNANLALTSRQNWMQAYDDVKRLYTPHHHIATPFIEGTFVKDSLINEGTIIRAKEVSHSVIGIKAQIGQGSVIKDTIIIGDHARPTIIGKNCDIRQTIIDTNAVIGDNVKLLNTQGLQKYDGEGVSIREGIIIVTAGAHILDGTVI